MEISTSSELFTTKISIVFDSTLTSELYHILFQIKPMPLGRATDLFVLTACFLLLSGQTSVPLLWAEGRGKALLLWEWHPVLWVGHWRTSALVFLICFSPDLEPWPYEQRFWYSTPAWDRVSVTGSWGWPMRNLDSVLLQGRNDSPRLRDGAVAALLDHTHLE